jgi:hypothetical protein
MEEVRDWERLFVGEIKAGRDPRIRPACKEAATDLQRVAGFLDAYLERHLRPAGIRSLDTAAGRIKVLKQHFGDLPVKTLDEPAIINRFKTESEYSRKVEISTLHKGPGDPARGHSLGPGADAATDRQVTVPPLWRSTEHQGGNGSRSADLTRGGEAASGRRAGDEHLEAPLGRAADARPHHRCAGALLPAR